ncbi:MAG: lipo-like protein [Hyphomicrobiaceae bacterium]|nr:lipo-like protein [Hyphomicrobiaceae bacterium]
MSFVDSTLDRIGQWLARILQVESSGYQPFTPSDPETLRRCLQPGDILLIEGNQKIAVAIKYLTQSTWSHAAMYVGNAVGEINDNGEQLSLIESNLGEGTVAVPLSKYETYNTRICRAVNLSKSDQEKVVRFMVASLGVKYDTRNIIDLARYLLPTPPVPVRWRRRMIALGSGSPTRAICSSLIAQAYHSVPYPILPSIEEVSDQPHAASPYSKQEILRIRHHSLFVPRDFDLSPFFYVVKPTIERGFDYRKVRWHEGEPGEGAIPIVGAEAKTSRSPAKS